jgi:hypothetical protein
MINPHADHPYRGRSVRRALDATDPIPEHPNSRLPGLAGIRVLEDDSYLWTFDKPGV